LIGVGGGEVTINVPAGQSQLTIAVRAPEGPFGISTGRYRIDINPPCSLGECNDANSCTDDVCDTFTSTCEFTALPDGTVCDFITVGDGLCGAGVCDDACGDGVLDAGETCDDGVQNGTGEGFCLSDCSGIQTCGDGTANGTETCDDGAQNGTGESFCLSDCSGTQICGDAIINGTEACESGDSAACITLGGNFTEGTAVCDVGCEAWDTAACVLSPDILICGPGCFRYNSGTLGAVVTSAAEEFTYFDGVADVTWNAPGRPTFGPEGLLWTSRTPNFSSDNFTDITVYDPATNELVSCHTLGQNNGRACELTGNSGNFWELGSWKMNALVGTHLDVLGTGNIGGYGATHHQIGYVDADANWFGVFANGTLSVGLATAAPPNLATWDQEEALYAVTFNASTSEDWITRFTFVNGLSAGAQDVAPLDATAGGPLYSGLESQIKRLRVADDGSAVFAYIRDNAFICGSPTVPSCADQLGIWRMDLVSGEAEHIIDLTPFSPQTNGVTDFAINPTTGNLYVTLSNPAAWEGHDVLVYEWDMEPGDPPLATAFRFTETGPANIEFFREMCPESPTEDPDCSPATCGDGYLNLSAGEACDGGGESPACNVDCTLSQCGDGVRNVAAGEWCDDGNNVGGDGCAADCSSEATQMLAYIAYQDISSQQEVYTAMADGFNNQKLNGPLVAGGRVLFLKWSPDGLRVAFTADQEVDNQVELYTANVDGTNLQKVNGALVAGGAVANTSFEWSPDGTRLAYLADQDTLNVNELYTAAPDGSDMHKVNGPLVVGGRVLNWSWSPDGTRLAYTARQDVSNVSELYSSAPDGTDNQKVSGTMVSGGNINTGPFRFSWSPSGTYLAYLADQDVNNEFELYVATPDGLIRNQVSGVLVSGGDVAGANGINTVEWSPDSSRIAYRADANTDQVFELFTNVPNGSDNRLVSGAMAGAGATFFAWSPDGTQVAYGATQDSPTKVEIYASAPDGTGNIKVNGPTTDGVQAFNTTVPLFVWAPDSARIVYRGGKFGQSGTFELYNASVSLSNTQTVNGPLVAGGSVDIFTWSPDGNFIAYLADQDTDNTRELYVSSPFGANNAKLSGPSVSGQGVLIQPGYETVQWSPDSSRVAYINDEDSFNRDELYTASPDGLIRHRANGPFVAGGQVTVYFGWRPPVTGFIACDITETTCPNGTSCYPTWSGDLCLPTGSGAEDAVCTSVNDCDPGLGCVSIPTDPTPTTYCRALCDEGLGIFCAGGDVCVDLAGASAMAACILDTCDLFSPVCPAGAGCYPTGYGYVCWYAGAGVQDDPCTDYRDCAAGLTCIDVAGPGTGLCLEICDPVSPVCPPGYGCAGTNDPSYGVCFQP